MHYIPNTKEEEELIFQLMGISDFSDLIKIIPKKLLLHEDLGLKASVSEMEISNELENLNNQNEQNICFLGSGIYDHYVPAVVDFISNRSEYYTAYTPYQPEVSQGTLQVLYEFQTMICELSGLDIANASLYDGASAVAEACSIAHSVTNNKIILYSNLINKNYLEVTKTYLSGRDIQLIKLPEINGITDLSLIKKYKDNIAAVIIQSPNKYGLIESWEDAKSKLTDLNSLLIAISDPMSLSILKSPGECGADIYIGEGQTLGNYMNYGGPLLGLMAIKNEYKRRMPGRIVGKTKDLNNKDGFVLTLQTREQHIRRENATSNICTNQGLIALRATIYLSLTGKNGLPKIAQLCYNKSQYAAKEISKLKNFDLMYSKSFLKEFIIKSKISASKVVSFCNDNKLLISKVIDDKTDSLIHIAVTEKRSKSNIDNLVSTLAKL